ncbi:hypothetical protein AGRA3207_007851 (plasmid) [Actinomadura graeca]|uniref:Uncharacterized protein n=1 Tax=Actinomadura graeca TaxID=2750812 RepID=A0ABX8R9R4_9ACTN|nr:hypothetical protein [Actinomadura graeca]QXJ27054.1 hypothetical protein AGRA3207_007851 [Actinomadura graeca]
MTKPTKGDRVRTTVRFPATHYRLYMEHAERLDVPMADYVVCRMAICDGLPIPAALYHSVPALIMMSEADDWPSILDGLPPVTAARVRRKLAEAAETDPQVRRDVKRLGLEEDGQQLAMTG